MDVELVSPIIDPLSLPHSPRLLLCYRLFSYLPWTDSSPHARQKLLECVAGGLHIGDSAISPFLTSALEEVWSSWDRAFASQGFRRGDYEDHITRVLIQDVW